jgi:hypothetical protein
MEKQMRKVLAVFVMMFCLGSVWAADNKPAPAPVAPQADSLSGKVLEVKDVESYTYLRLKTRDGEMWAAVTKTPVKVGAEVTVSNVHIMTNFESKTLNRKFDKIAFGSIGGAGAGAAAGGDLGAVHAGVAKPVDAADVKVDKATGPGARTVAEINTGRAALKDKPVVVRGKVVKVTPEVMGKNWIHLRDGSGLATDGSNDVLVTSKDMAKVGDIVLVKGVVHTDRDLGSGYSYKVLVEEATLQK